MSKLAEIGIDSTNGAGLTVLGTVASFIGQNGKLTANPRNLTGSKGIYFDLTDEDGLTRRVFCSKGVTALVREKKLTPGQILGLEIAEFEMTEGEYAGTITQRIISPQVESVEIKGSVKVEKTEVEVTDFAW